MGVLKHADRRKTQPVEELAPTLCSRNRFLIFGEMGGLKKSTYLDHIEEEYTEHESRLTVYVNAGKVKQDALKEANEQAKKRASYIVRQAYKILNQRYSESLCLMQVII